MAGEERMDLKETHVFARGHHHYFASDRNERGEVQFRMNQPPGVDVTWWFEHNGQLARHMLAGADPSLSLI